MFLRLELGFDAAGTRDAPTADGFKHGKQTCYDKNQSKPQRVINGDNTRDKANRADDAARHAAPKIEVPAEETVHEGKIKRGLRLKQIVRWKMETYLVGRASSRAGR